MMSVSKKILIPYSKNMTSDPSKLKLFSAVFVALVLAFFFYSYTIVSASFNRHSTESLLTFDEHVALREKINGLDHPLRSINEEIAGIEIDTNPYTAPRKASEVERVAWLMRSLPRLEIFKPDKEFHSRVLQFFDDRCEVRIFMTWISPAESFSGREILAVESLFKSHPKGCLVILSRTLDTPRGYHLLKPVVDRGFRVNAVTPDLSFLVKGTPAESWLSEMKRGDRDPGEISLAQNLSNLMRLVVLYKYGGIYMDTDFVVLKPLTGLRNSIGAQSMNVETGNWTRLNNAVLIFDMNHPLLLSFIQEFALTFDGNKWGFNGPYLVSRVVRKLSPERGDFDFTVLSPAAFYPVDWTKISGLFQRPNDETQARWVKAKIRQLSGDTYGIHLWNKQSNKLRIEQGSVIGRLISDHCVICKDIYSS